MDILTLFDNLRQEQEKERRVISPVLGNSRITLNIEGVVCHLPVKNHPVGYYGIAELIAHGTAYAEFIGDAPFKKAQDYLNVFTTVYMTLVEQTGEHQWLAVHAYNDSHWLKFDEPVKVYLVPQYNQRFDSIVCKAIDNVVINQTLWIARNPMIASHLRYSYHHKTEPSMSGMLPSDYRAFDTANKIRHIKEKANQPTPEEVIKLALQVSDATLVDWNDLGDHYILTYRDNQTGQEHAPTIRKENLQVRTAGICLSGQDDDFDLTSLVTVTRKYDQEIQW